MAAEASVSIVLLSACFSLIFWNALILRKFNPAKGPPGLLCKLWPSLFRDIPYILCALQVGWVAAAGYLLWSGTEQYTPPGLLDNFTGQMFTATFALFFLFIGFESLLNQHIDALKSNYELGFFCFLVCKYHGLCTCFKTRARTLLRL